MCGYKLCYLAGFLALVLQEGTCGSSPTIGSANGLLATSMHQEGQAEGIPSLQPTTVDARSQQNDSGSTENSGLLLGEGAYVSSMAGGETSFLLSPVVHRVGPADKLSLPDLDEPTSAAAKSEESVPGISENSEKKSDATLTSFSVLRGDKAEDVTDECIEEHNKKRVGELTHPLKPVSRDSAAVDQAMKYMRHVVDNGCKFQHSGAPGFGENMYATSAPVANCAGAVHAWYNEINYFNGKYPAGNWKMESGHFTQVMWHSSTGLGCARTVGCPGSILVCNYKPPGNFVGAPPFDEDVWNSIMEVSGDLGTGVVSRLACLLTVAAATITSFAVTA